MRGDELRELAIQSERDWQEDRREDMRRFGPPSAEVADGVEFILDADGKVIGCRYEGMEVEVVII